MDTDAGAGRQQRPHRPSKNFAMIVLPTFVLTLIIGSVLLATQLDGSSVLHRRRLL